MSGYKDFFLLLSPGDEMIKAMRHYKSLAKSIISTFPSAESTAHLSIKQYVRKRHYELDSMIDQLESRLRCMPSVKLKTNNFNFFIHAKDRMTVYAEIQPTYETDNWIACLRKELNLNNDEFVPHITVARNIDVDAFYRLWPTFSNLICKQDFVVDKLYILERETFGNDRKWKIYKEIPFERKLKVV